MEDFKGWGFLMIWGLIGLEFGEVGVRLKGGEFGLTCFGLGGICERIGVDFSGGGTAERISNSFVLIY